MTAQGCIPELHDSHAPVAIICPQYGNPLKLSGAAPRRLLVTLGYAGWAGGQLEHEISQNAWLTTPADLGILFDLPPEQKLDAAAAQLGIDMRMLSSDAGHA